MSDPLVKLQSQSELLARPNMNTEDPVLLRQRQLALMGVLMGTQPTEAAGRLLATQSEAESDRREDRANREAAARIRADEKADERAWREQVHKDLQDYRYRQGAGGGGGLTPYQQESLRRRDEAQAAAKDARLNADVLKYGADLAGVSELQAGIEQADRALAPHLAKGGDIPGVGGWANSPGFIGTVAAKLEGGSDVRNALAPVRNLILKARSGGAVTPQEADRLLNEFGQVMGANDADFVRAWSNFKSRHGALLNGIAAKYSTEAVDEYNRRAAAREAAQPAPTQGRGASGSWDEPPKSTEPEWIVGPDGKVRRNR